MTMNPDIPRLKTAVLETNRTRYSVAVLDGCDRAITGAAIIASKPCVAYSAGALVNELARRNGIGHPEALDLFMKEVEPMEAPEGTRPPAYIWTPKYISEFHRIIPRIEYRRSEQEKKDAPGRARSRILDFLATWLIIGRRKGKHPLKAVQGHSRQSAEDPSTRHRGNREAER